jgi:hypothetical protein
MAFWGETLARRVALAVGDSVASAVALAAVPAQELATGMIRSIQADNTLAVYSGTAWEQGSLVKKRTVTITSADLTTAGVGPESENVGAVIPVNGVVLGYRAKLTDAFDNGAGVSLTMEIGHDNDVDAYEDGIDVFTASALEGAGWVYGTTGPGIGAPAYDGTSTGQVVATFTAGGDQLVNFTNGSVTVEVFYIEMA